MRTVNPVPSDPPPWRVKRPIDSHLKAPISRICAHHVLAVGSSGIRSEQLGGSGASVNRDPITFGAGLEIVAELQRMASPTRSSG